MSYVVSELGNTIYAYNGSLIGLQTGGILDVNLVNFGSDSAMSGTMRTEGGVLNSANEGTASFSLNGGDWHSVDFLGAGTMQTLKLLFIPVLAVPAMAFAVDGQVYLYLPNGPALLSGVASSFSLSATTGMTLPSGRNVCLANGSRITTAKGERLIESLQVGDLILTKDRGLRPLLLIESQAIPVAQQVLWDHQRPIKIAKGSFGRNRPRCDLYVSQQHCVLLRHAHCERLARAKHLVGREGITTSSPRPFLRYYHLLFDRHELIRADGLWVESLYLGPEALGSLSPATLAKIRQHDCLDTTAPPVRPILSRHDLSTRVTV